METPAQKLCELVGKKFLLLAARGNEAIKFVLSVLRMRGEKRVLLQDMGGWITYSQFTDKLKFEKVELKTDYGLVEPKDLEKFKDSVLLINSMPGYASLQDMEELIKIAKKNNIFVINDASGSIGTDEAKYGDIILGSFGKAKPIEIGEGAFIATDDEGLYKELCELNLFTPDDNFLDALEKKLGELDARLSFFQLKRHEAIDGLNSFDIIHKDGGGINIIVKYKNKSEKEDIIAYCNEQKLEFVLCPKYIRVNAEAVSIEIKRLQEDYSEEIDEEYDEVE